MAYRFFLAAALLFGIGHHSLAMATGYTLQSGKFIANEELATMSVQEHYSAAMIAFEEENWEELVRQCRIILKNFPDTVFAMEGQYYIATAYAQIKDYQMANHFISAYLKSQTTPKHFEEAIQLKFAIAEAFRMGARKHLLSMKSLPKWVPADEDALAAYEEVIAALPHDEMAAKALFGKGKVLLEMEDYKESVEAFQTVIRRFPKHEHAVDSYLAISEAYLQQFRDESPDRDLLDLAEINVRKMQADFPREELIGKALGNLVEMQEIYAHNLYETARFYERRKKPEASLLYYRKIAVQFPETKAAALSKKRIDVLKPAGSENIVPQEIVSTTEPHAENPPETSN
jgi:outer membrane protein assembly factor BamD (BamD/ComL family)